MYAKFPGPDHIGFNGVANHKYFFGPAPNTFAEVSVDFRLWLHGAGFV
jgi:hypothetical protein